MPRTALQHVTVTLDPRLMETEMGLAIGAKLRETQAGPPDKAVAFVVRDANVEQARAVRWRRRVLEQPEDEAEQPVVKEVDAGHALICFQAPEFVEAWQRDGLDSLFTTLESCCPRARAHLLICGLSAHISRVERAEHARQMRGEAQGAGPAPAPLRRGQLEDFLTGLAITRPSLAVREVVDGHEAAEHILLLTSSIARSVLTTSDSTQWFQAHSKRWGTAMDGLLVKHPVPAGAEQGLHALCMLPSVLPSIAHAMVARFGTLGGLMDELAMRDQGGRQQDGSGPIREFQNELEFMMRTGCSRPTRVGPKAAASLVKWLACTDPSRLVRCADQE